MFLTDSVTPLFGPVEFCHGQIKKETQLERQTAEHICADSCCRQTDGCAGGDTR